MFVRRWVKVNRNISTQDGKRWIFIVSGIDFSHLMLVSKPNFAPMMVMIKVSFYCD